jgi:hypothetical protein
MMFVKQRDVVVLAVRKDRLAYHCSDMPNGEIESRVKYNTQW